MDLGFREFRDENYHSVRLLAIIPFVEVALFFYVLTAFRLLRELLSEYPDSRF